MAPVIFVSQRAHERVSVCESGEEKGECAHVGAWVADVKLNVR